MENVKFFCLLLRGVIQPEVDIIRFCTVRAMSNFRLGLLSQELISDKKVKSELLIKKKFALNKLLINFFFLNFDSCFRVHFS